VSTNDPFSDDFDFSDLDQPLLLDVQPPADVAADAADESDHVAVDVADNDAAEVSDDVGDVDRKSSEPDGESPHIVDESSEVAENSEVAESSDVDDDSPYDDDEGSDEMDRVIPGKVVIVDGPEPVVTVIPAVTLTRSEIRARKAQEKADAKALAKTQDKPDGKVKRRKLGAIGDDAEQGGLPIGEPSNLVIAPADEAPPKIRKVVIAEDDEPLDLSTISKSPQIDPRVRKRRIAVKRAAGRRRFRWVVVFGVLAVLVVAALVVLASPIFSVKQINVVGARYTDPQQLGPILDDFNGDPILTVDPKKIEAEVEALPWVRRAEVDVAFPRTITIRIAEREPAAAYRGIDGRWRIIDRTARVIAIEANQPADFLPVAGAGPDLEPGETAGSMIATLAELAEVIGDLPQLDALVVRLEADGTDLTMTMLSPGGTGVQVVLGTASQLRNKLSVLLTLLDDPELNLDETLQINLTDPAKPAY
jgi:cell division septal protein FtsQ